MLPVRAEVEANAVVLEDGVADQVAGVVGAGVHARAVLLAEVAADREAVPEENLVRYLTTIEGIVDTYRSRLGESANRGLQLGLAIPFWLDGRGDAPGPGELGDGTKPAAYHLIDMVGDLPGAYLVIMAYRHFTRTSDGSIAHARVELRYDALTGARAGLVVGQQYGPAPGEPHIAFHGQPRRQFLRAAAEITLAFRRYRQLRGLSVDDLDAFMAAGP